MVDYGRATDKHTMITLVQVFFFKVFVKWNIVFCSLLFTESKTPVWKFPIPNVPTFFLPCFYIVPRYGKTI